MIRILVERISIIELLSTAWRNSKRKRVSTFEIIREHLDDYERNVNVQSEFFRRVSKQLSKSIR